LEVDLTERRVIRAGKVVDLTPREFDLLRRIELESESGQGSLFRIVMPTRA
jgi:DNA-binding response OmpR family regulator